jgi:hypothetical protein
MSRSGYIEDYESNWPMICWRGAVASAIRGRRGQAFLRDMLTALDSLEDKCLIKSDLVTPYGDVCAIGAVGVSRGINMTPIDPEDRDSVANTFGISPALAAEIMYLNDEWPYRETPKDRFSRMRAWIASEIKTPTGAA